MKVSKEEILHIAKLADLTLNDNEVETYLEHLQDILEFANTVNNAPVEGLDITPDLIIIDALEHIDTKGVPYESIIKGDAKCYSIGAASIIAKVTRDRIMREWDTIYPQYGFAQHKGYGTKMHMQAIREYGLTPIHRRSFTKNIVHQ